MIAKLVLPGVLVAGLATTAHAFDQLTVVAEAWPTLRAWFADGYARAPAIVIGLGALMLVPPLAIAGLLLRRGLETHPMPGPEISDSLEMTREGWIEIEGIAGSRHPIGLGMLRIGRQDDNDLCLADKTVHRYHAVIHRSPDAEFIITDLSGPSGNGMTVNGIRVPQARLASGDRLALGAVRLKFEAVLD
jgi:hypothetical protein